MGYKPPWEKEETVSTKKGYTPPWERTSETTEPSERVAIPSYQGDREELVSSYDKLKQLSQTQTPKTDATNYASQTPKYGTGTISSTTEAQKNAEIAEPRKVDDNFLNSKNSK